MKGGRVLDVGCSGGYFLSKFNSDSWDRYGVEIAKDAGLHAKEQFGIPVRIGNVKEIEFDGQFDLITMRGTIEHMYDPISTLEKCCQLLVPNGFLFITATQQVTHLRLMYTVKNGDCLPLWSTFIFFQLIY